MALRNEPNERERQNRTLRINTQELEGWRRIGRMWNPRWNEMKSLGEPKWSIILVALPAKCWGGLRPT